MNEVERIIAQQGFDATGTGAASDLTVREEVRAMCAADKCHVYGRSWACPPACGSIEEFQEQMSGYDTFTVVQTVKELEDEFDGEGMMEAAQLQKERFLGLVEALADAGLSSQVMALSSGTCTLCETCTYPDAPCRFPEKRLVSMEAAGLVVSESCSKAGIPYNHGPNTIAYSGCILYNKS